MALRVAETKALDWKDVELAGGFIHVGPKISKTRTRRLVPILENLRAWLQPIAKPSGPVVERELRYRHEAARERAGIKEWPKNCMRHSFVSYRLAATQNALQTAPESGHDQSVLFKYYRELVRPKDAERFFSISPPGKDAEEKIVSISAGIFARSEARRRLQRENPPGCRMQRPAPVSLKPVRSKELQSCVSLWTDAPILTVCSLILQFRLQPPRIHWS